MKISLNWLRSLIDLEMPPEDLSAKLLNLGFETESIETIGAQFSGVVIAEVKKVGPHPNADRLSLCVVSDGAETCEVVCGAPNVAEGQRIALAKIGAKLPGDFRIKKSKIRGAVSNGMICSAKELGLSSNGEDKGILVLGEDAVVGTDFSSITGEPDVVLDLDVTPNRPDCLSHLGLARELAITLGREVRRPGTDGISEDGPNPWPVAVEDAEECPRYVGRIVEGVRVGPSPDWLRRRLESIGLRPINNVVDVTNFVLHETGQPMHAFDADKLAGDALSVRAAREGEKIVALDETEYALSPENLVIADAEGPVAVAGVIGGLETAVTAGTSRLFLEFANFRPTRVRRSAKRLAVRTDSSYRFERGADLGGIPAAAARATALILELAGGKTGPLSDTNASPAAHRPIDVSARRMNEILGSDFPDDRILPLLKRIGEIFQDASGRLSLVPPSYRLDLATPNDLAEEVARHLGYDAIGEDPAPAHLPVPEPDPVRDACAALGATLCGLGFSEAYHRDMVSETALVRFLGRAPKPGDHPKLLNPLSEEWAYLRPSLLIGLMGSAASNLNHGAHGVRLFELGRVYTQTLDGVRERLTVSGILAGPVPSRAHWTGPGREPDFFSVKGAVEALLRDYRTAWKTPAAPDALFHPKACLELNIGNKTRGVAGLLHPSVAKAWDLGDRPVGAFEIDIEELPQWKARRARFAGFSPFPSSSRDLSLLVDAGARYESLERAVGALKLESLDSVSCIDVFEGDGLPVGKKSVTLRLSFSHPERTLKDEEVQAAVAKAVEALAKECGAQRRG
ncbi:MAG: phenylalanine--tRNA ligase subunit beta [Elusimicrobia bacterium CG_4_9_14_3_um_filter_62_55]|nr:MAG: phenylalanine--tRNA ligase subunit beta [Elusimicrobia bacterium CG22_combo_CG10-13_8_21_14_all_63_91]PJA16126.1 MAG: phenylalanine--tRNA ligase subunit beta [Elusimicrobia bacterium CG_4_10_14_0_2_um_filter_63_34]PJB26202.1 MAG: phenylalanine--tRNA ligase subunit beta [Elusimicrobia bacterium CG_4_9_14_3_um_filter_62_55]